MNIQGCQRANVAFDPKHARPCGIAPPQEGDEVIFLRCRVDKGGCNRLYSNWEFRRNGGCPNCGTIYSWGSLPRGKRRAFKFRGREYEIYTKLFIFPSWEWLRILFWSLTGNWRMYGPERGWGWKLKPALPPEMGKESIPSS